MSVQVTIFPKGDTEVKVSDGGAVAFWTHQTTAVAFHSVADALAWLAQVTADLYVAAYSDEVTA